jgi:hypothetical protein
MQPLYLALPPQGSHVARPAAPFSARLVNFWKFLEVFVKS